MKLFNNKADAFYSDFCFIDIVSFVNGVLSSGVSENYLGRKIAAGKSLATDKPVESKHFYKFMGH